MGAGMTYENTDGDWARRCVAHGGWEMFHTCAGGEGEPLGYCSAWDGEKVDRKPTCQFTVS